MGRRPCPEPARRSGPHLLDARERGPPGRGAVGHDLRRHLRRPGPHVHRGRRASCSTPCTARPRHPPEPARAGSPPPRFSTSSQAARSSPATPKAYDPPPLPRPSPRVPGGDHRLRRLSPHHRAGGRETSSAVGPTAAHQRQRRCSLPRMSASSTGSARWPRCPTRRRSVRALAAQAGPVPAARRRGTLVLMAAPGSPGPERQLPAGRARRRPHVLRADHARRTPRALDRRAAHAA